MKKGKQAPYRERAVIDVIERLVASKRLQRMDIHEIAGKLGLGYETARLPIAMAIAKGLLRWRLEPTGKAKRKYNK